MVLLGLNSDFCLQILSLTFRDLSYRNIQNNIHANWVQRENDLCTQWLELSCPYG
jgi:hypothetical protein